MRYLKGGELANLRSLHGRKCMGERVLNISGQLLMRGLYGYLAIKQSSKQAGRRAGGQAGNSR